MPDGARSRAKIDGQRRQHHPVSGFFPAPSRRAKAHAQRHPLVQARRGPHAYPGQDRARSPRGAGKRHTAIDETGVDPWNVGRTTIGEVAVSTAFLGLDHNRLGRGTPILFETMIFGADGDSLHQNRCSTWEQAEAMHAEAVEKMRSLKVVK